MFLRLVFGKVFQISPVIFPTIIWQFLTNREINFQIFFINFLTVHNISNSNRATLYGLLIKHSTTVNEAIKRQLSEILETGRRHYDAVWNFSQTSFVISVAFRCLVSFCGYGKKKFYRKKSFTEKKFYRKKIIFFFVTVIRQLQD